MTKTIFPLEYKAIHSSDVFDCASDISLGGCFYDYLQAEDGGLVGVRYWLIEAVAFEGHPVYASFLSDRRFIFAPREGYVDMVFEERDAEALRRGALQLDVVQDFGGERVLKGDGAFGIGFSFQDDRGERTKPRTNPSARHPTEPT